MYAGHHVFTVTEYLAFEERSRDKHEYLGGRVVAMAGGSRAHALVAANVVALLASALRGKRCAVHSADLRLGAEESGLFTYADAAVICGRVETDPRDPTGHTVRNPRVVVEVLSPSTEDYDRGEKLGHYKSISSLQEVVLVAHDRREVEVVRREPDGSWSRAISGPGGRVALSSLGCDLRVEDIYEDPLAERPRTKAEASRPTTRKARRRGG